jgi:hypothetical protein
MSAAGRLLVAMLVLVGLACPLAYGQAREVRQGDAWFHGWTFDVAPFYLWLPALDGRITVGETSAGVDQSVGDTLDLALESLKFGATGRAEARKGNALLTLDLMYMDLGENVQTDVGAGVTVRSKQLILEFGGGYHLLDWSVAGEGTPSLAVDVLAGGRYVDLDSGITIENVLDVDRSQDWLDPFIGGRLRFGHYRPVVGLSARGHRRLRRGLTFYLESGRHPEVSSLPTGLRRRRVSHLGHQLLGGQRRPRVPVRRPNAGARAGPRPPLLEEPGGMHGHDGRRAGLRRVDEWHARRSAGDRRP